MSNLPPDIQEQLDKQKASRPAGMPAGIGSAAPENVKRMPRTEVAAESATEPTVAVEDLSCRNTFCKAEVPTSAAYCAKCGFDQLHGGLEKRLGITEFDDSDVQDYIFRGYVVRDIKLLGKHVVTVRSSQAKDLKEIDTFIMNGDWSKTKEGKEKQVSEFFLRQMNAMAIAAMAVQKLDGQSIGESLTDKMKWFEERGSGFVDLVSSKVTLFNQALTDHLKKEDSFSGS